MTHAAASTTRRATLALLLLAFATTAVWLGIESATQVRTVTDSSQPLPSGSDEAGRELEGASSTRQVDSARAILGAQDVRSAPVLSSSAPSRGCRIHGRVLEAWNEPVRDLTLWIVQADIEAKPRYFVPPEMPSGEVATDERGEFEFLDVVPGPWLVGPAPSRASKDTPATNDVAAMGGVVVVHAGDDAKQIEIHVQRGLVIRGRVLQPGGAPAATGIVGARAPEASVPLFTPTRTDGTFTIGPLIAGPYELWADGDSEGTASATVLTFAGDEDVVLQLREGGSFSGRVIDARAGGSDRPMLFAMRQDVEPYEMLSTPSDAEGYFHFENVTPGRYQVIAKTEDAWFAIRSGFEVAAGRATSDLVLELREGGDLRLQRKNGERTRVEIRQDDVRILSSEIHDEDTSLPAPAGRITIRWKSSSGSTGEEHLEIHPGREGVVVIAD